MNYSYEILNAEPQHKFLSVRYFAEGRDNFFKNFNPEDWSSVEALVEIIENFAPYVITHWTYQESAETSSPIAIGDINTSSAEALTEIIYTTADMPLVYVRVVSTDRHYLSRVLHFALANVSYY